MAFLKTFGNKINNIPFCKLSFWTVCTMNQEKISNSILKR